MQPEKTLAIDPTSLDYSMSFLSRDIWLFNDSMSNGLDFSEPLAEDVISTICMVPPLSFNTITPLPVLEANSEYHDQVIANAAVGGDTCLEDSALIPIPENINFEGLQPGICNPADKHVASDQSKSSFISSSYVEAVTGHKEVNYPAKKRGRPRKRGKVSEPSYISPPEGNSASEAERAKRAAHSMVEKRYRTNLNHKLDELKIQLASISESEGTDLTLQLKMKHPYQESKPKREMAPKERNRILKNPGNEPRKTYEMPGLWIIKADQCYSA
ncbi:hypothetical protein H072_5147 [Dactylellina haptotyla CBS 200.50]|uniref:BHLH domain-containing protein n=1 Tax=Dactylellina haptotyla (strain CBS 200.50) TaxID=1284197 RepID=S8ADE3_DACHA|nr:hypothetical protein H072_5147 [Dactylellina haptotyla CBS 200.50]